MAENLWVEKYRPKKIDDCILANELKETFKQFVKQKEIPNLLLSGTAGTGKTTVARALCEELGADYLVINGSDEGRQIDTLRNKIKNFASTVSFEGTGHKVVIIDEADYMNAESVQPALRNFIETFYKNCRFIFTCNYKNKIIEPLHSRCAVVDFSIGSKEKVRLAGVFFNRVKEILDTENINYDEKVVAEVIKSYFPDWRRVLNELQRYASIGNIDTGILSSMSDVNMKDLVKDMKEKNFGKVRKWVVENLDNDPSSVYRKVYENMYKSMDPSSIPQAVLIFAKYQYQAVFAVDQEINTLACFTELMCDCNFK